MLKNLVKKFFGSSEAVSTGAETSNVLSLYALQHAEHFKCASSTDESAMFIDLNSVRSVEHNPPNYTLQFNMYLVEYKKKHTIEWVVTADYDYEYSVSSIVKKENLKDYSREQANVKHEGAFEYGDPFYTAAHYAFDRAYHVFF